MRLIQSRRCPRSDFFRTLKRAAVVLAVVGICLCAKKKSAEREPGLVVGNDTVSVARVDSLAPDLDVSGSIRSLRLARQWALKGDTPLPPRDTPEGALVDELAQQLNRKSGVDWSYEAAGCLLAAGRQLSKKAKEIRSLEGIRHYVDSSVQSTAVVKDERQAKKKPDPKAGAQGLPKISDWSSPKEMCDLFTDVLLLAEDLACLVHDFVVAGSVSLLDSKDLTEMVNGIVADQSQKKRPKQRTRSLKRDQTARRALKARPQKTIQDTVMKHSANLQALYRKCLKTNPNISGIVWAKLTVSPSGDVVAASVKKSDIRDGAFIKPFLRYVRTMNFMPVSDDVGDMSFVYPFEFTPE